MSDGSRRAIGIAWIECCAGCRADPGRECGGRLTFLKTSSAETSAMETIYF